MYQLLLFLQGCAESLMSTQLLIKVACLYLDFHKESSALFNRGMFPKGRLVRTRVFILIIFLRRY